MRHASADGRISWIAAVALVALLAGLVAWFANWRAVAPENPEPIDPLAAFDSTSDAVIDRALGQIPVDSTELKQRWMDDIKQIEVAALTPRQLEHFVRFANARQCTCGCGYTLAACRTFDQPADPRGVARFDHGRIHRQRRAPARATRRHAVSPDQLTLEKRGFAN